MSDLTQEQYEQLPEFIRNDYTEVDGVYKHAGLVKVKQTANELDSKLKASEKSIAELSDKMNTFEQQKQADIEAATATALENAKTDKDVEEIERIHNQKMADLEKRVEQRTREAIKTEAEQAAAKEKAQSTASRIAESIAVDEDAQALLTSAFDKRISIDADGAVTFMNEDGTASSLDEAGFLAEVQASPRYKRLRKAKVTTTDSGKANGSGNGGGRTAGDANNEAAEAAKKKGDLAGYLNAALKL